MTEYVESVVTFEVSIQSMHKKSESKWVFFDRRSYFILFRVMLLCFVPNVGRECGYLTWNQTSRVKDASPVGVFIFLEGFVSYFSFRRTKPIIKSQGANRKD